GQALAKKLDGLGRDVAEECSKVTAQQGILILGSGHVVGVGIVPRGARRKVLTIADVASRFTYAEPARNLPLDCPPGRTRAAHQPRLSPHDARALHGERRARTAPGDRRLDCTSPAV